ncbi:HNH endonuclease [Arthrobacter gallicola]|uniref:HNH endonuclease n=1 Tax=Arthrobacter gallicola TaxID=2762225 RepID=UPI00296AD54B|nr:DUF222 domain-containing protein [Arthrobacter gallicola]
MVQALVSDVGQWITRLQEHGTDGERPDTDVTGGNLINGDLANRNLADRNLTDHRSLADRVLVDLIRVLEELKAAAAAAQARAAAAFDASQRQAQTQAGLPAAQLGRGVGAQIALARRDSPHRGRRHLGLGKALVHEMPHTLHTLSTGVLSEWRATLLVRETACLDVEDRRRVDALVCGNPAALEGIGDRKLIARIRTHTQAIDPASQVRRHAKAVADRYVSCRPAPDTMSYLTGLLPVAQGVAVFTALSRAADSLRSSGDERGRGQIMADTLVERITGQATASQVPVEVQLVITDRTLFTRASHDVSSAFEGGAFEDNACEGDVCDGDTCVPEAEGPKANVPGTAGTASSLPGTAATTLLQDEPAYFPGYGVVPGGWARDLITNALDGHGQDPPTDELPPRPHPDVSTHPAHDQAPLTLRRLYLAPATGELVAMDSRARCFPPGLARLIRTRDQTCRTPWCDAPIRHVDHIRPHAEAGPTSYANGQGLCEACNQAKEAPGWKARTVNTPGQRHTVRTTTPTGHTYRSTAPPLPGAVSR